MKGSESNMMIFFNEAQRYMEPSGEARKFAESSVPQGLTEETIDLSAWFAEDVSPSGSFDLRRSRLSSFGKLLQAIPIPTLLVDESSTIAFANRACTRAAGEPGSIEGRRFSALFPNRTDGVQAEELIQKVFHNRIPLVVEGNLGTNGARMLGRIHFRSVRIQKTRMMLVIIEDITPSKPCSGKTSVLVI
ncbi:MAG: PAS domain-containing protein [Desulfomonilaceae bacterium]